MNNTILLYTARITPRMSYICDFMLTALLGLRVHLTENIQELDTWSGPAMVYDTAPQEDHVWCWAHGLLQESKIHPVVPDVSSFNGVPTLFSAPVHFSPVVPFDPFAAAFYMLSRYEEYTETRRDKHERFTAMQSLAFVHGFLRKPVVHYWAGLLKEQLTKKFPGLEFRQPVYGFTPTLDIDNAFAYRNKGFFRTMGALARDLLRFDLKGLFARMAVLIGRRKDPYDSFKVLRELHEKYSVKPVIFWLLGDYGPFDKNISPDNKNFRNLIAETGKNSVTGIHLSYGAVSPGTMSRERERLEKIMHSKVSKSRMHYLRLHLPVTYTGLISAGITDDYTMGFSEESGFRAGVAVPFYFYDLEKEVKTGLRVHPFCIMDATLKYYKGLSAEEAMSEISEMIIAVKAVGGHFYPLFHNESLGTKEMWKGWTEVYRRMLEEAIS